MSARRRDRAVSRLHVAVLAGLALAGLSSPTVRADEPRAPEGSKDGAESPSFEGARREIYKTVDGVELAAWIFEPAPANDASPITTDSRRPATARARPAIVFFFGGGWRSGTPAQFEPHARYFAHRGLVAVLVDYRVQSRHGVGARECVEDAKSAVRWLRSNAKRLDVDPSRIVAAGGSAGGHLAAATGTLSGYEDPEDAARVSSAPDAMVLFNPGLVLASIGEYQLAPMGWTRGRLNDEPESLSPAHHVRANLAPAIIFHGTADTTVPFSSAEVFRDLMRKAGNRCELVAYADEKHGFFNRGRGDGSAYLDTVARADRFLASLGYLEGEPSIERFERAASERERKTLPGHDAVKEPGSRGTAGSRESGGEKGTGSR